MQFRPSKLTWWQRRCKSCHLPGSFPMRLRLLLTAKLTSAACCRFHNSCLWVWWLKPVLRFDGSLSRLLKNQEYQWPCICVYTELCFLSQLLTKMADDQPVENDQREQTAPPPRVTPFLVTRIGCRCQKRLGLVQGGPGRTTQPSWNSFQAQADATCSLLCHARHQREETAVKPASLEGYRWYYNGWKASQNSHDDVEASRSGDVNDPMNVNDPYEYFVFRSRTQKEEESTEVLTMSPWELNKTCGMFDDMHDKLLKHQLIFALRDRTLTEKLLHERGLTVGKYLDIWKVA